MHTTDARVNSFTRVSTYIMQSHIHIATAAASVLHILVYAHIT